MKIKEKEIYLKSWSDCEEALQAVVSEEQHNKLDAWFIQARKRMNL